MATANAEENRRDYSALENTINDISMRRGSTVTVTIKMPLRKAVAILAGAGLAMLAVNAATIYVVTRLAGS